MFSESLTVRILGDSSGLRTELETSLSLLDTFEKRLAAIGAAGQQLSAGFSGIPAALAPVELLGQKLTGVFQQMLAISQTPLTLNVQPALAALLKLTATIEAVAARLRGLSNAATPASGAAPASPAGAHGPSAAPAAPPTAAAAAAPLPATPLRHHGGPPAPLLTAPLRLSEPSALPLPGTLSRMALPALIPAGSALISPAPTRVQDFPRDPFSSRAFRTPSDARPRFEPIPNFSGDRPAAAPSPVTTTNHFGGIAIHVRETADVNNLVRDLRLQGIHLRNRRG